NALAAVAVRIPGESHARSEGFVAVVQVAVGNSRIAVEEQAGRRVGVLGRLPARLEVALRKIAAAAERVSLRHEGLPAQAHVEVQPAVELHVILPVDGDRVLPERHAVGLNLGDRGEPSEQKIEHGVLSELAVEGHGSVSVKQVEFVELEPVVIGAYGDLVASV